MQVSVCGVVVTDYSLNSKFAVLKAKNNELKQMLMESQVGCLCLFVFHLHRCKSKASERVLYVSAGCSSARITIVEH